MYYSSFMIMFYCLHITVKWMLPNFKSHGNITVNSDSNTHVVQDGRMGCLRTCGDNINSKTIRQQCISWSCFIHGHFLYYSKLTTYHHIIQHLLCYHQHFCYLKSIIM